MATTETDDIGQVIPSEEEVEEIIEEQEDTAEDSSEDSHELNQELNEDYPTPQEEQKLNQWTILGDSLTRQDTLRTTFLNESELGKPLFSVRNYLDWHEMANHAGAGRVADYLWKKVQNITGSGMSNGGFAMNLNVTQKRDTTRKRTREVNIQSVQTKGQTPAG